MTSITKSGWESMGTWLLATSVTLAPIRLATNHSMSGWTVRSFLATMYQLGFDFQAVPPTFALNRSGAGTHCVAQTSFFSCSDKPVEVLERGVLDAGRLGDAGVGDQDVEAVADDGADLPGQGVRTFGLAQVGTDLFGLAAGLADHGNDGVRLLLAAAVMHQHPGAGCGERQRARAANAARGAGDQGRFSGKTGHGHGPQALVPPSTVRLAPVM